VLTNSPVPRTETYRAWSEKLCNRISAARAFTEPIHIFNTDIAVMLCAMRFTKMHGIGNDYVYIDGFKEPSPIRRTSRARCRTGISGSGSDGLILISPLTRPTCGCGCSTSTGPKVKCAETAIRCVAKYAYDHGLSTNNPMRVETGRGVLTLDLKTAAGKVDVVTVNMASRSSTRTRFRSTPGTQSQPKTRASSAMRWKVRRSRSSPSHRQPALVNVRRRRNEARPQPHRPLAENHAAFPSRVNAHWPR